MLPKEDTSPQKRPARFSAWGDLGIVTLIFFGATVVAGVCGVAVMALAPEISKELFSAILYAVAFSLSIAGAYVYYMLSNRRSGDYDGTGVDGKNRNRLFRFSFNWLDAPIILWGITLITAGGILIEPLLNLFPEHYFEQLNNAIGSGGAAVVMLVMLAPIFEEMFFRGLVLEQVSRRWKIWQAVIVSALFFGLVHLPILPQMVNAFVMGIILGFIYKLTRSLIPVIVIHAVNNGIAYLLLEMTGTQNTDTRQMIGNDPVYWTIFAASALIVVVSLVCMWVFAKKSDTKRGEIPLHEEITDNA